MMGNLTLIIFSLFIVSTKAQISLDDIINEIFLKQNSTVETTTASFLEKLFKTTSASPERSEETGAYKSCGINRECVPRHLCVDGVVSRSGENFLNIRMNDKGCSYSEICCDVSNKVGFIKSLDFFVNIFMFYINRDPVPSFLPSPRNNM